MLSVGLSLFPFSNMRLSSFPPHFVRILKLALNTLVFISANHVRFLAFDADDDDDDDDEAVETLSFLYIVDCCFKITF